LSLPGRRSILGVAALVVFCVGCSYVASEQDYTGSWNSVGSGGAAPAGVYHRVEPGQTLYRIGQAYGVDPGEIARVNGIADPTQISVGTCLWVPGASQSLSVEPTLTGLRRGQTCWPVHGRITSKFGMRVHPVSGKRRKHQGLDIAAPIGTPVRVAERGRVRFAGWSEGYGNLLIIDHGRGFETRYGHNSELAVRAREFVYKGQVVARSGSTGVSTGPHVHFEVRISDRPVDPRRYLP